MPIVHPPITLIAGFLGAGKTSTLMSMLQNRRGLKIAVLVNDLAAVNVDAATVRRATESQEGIDTIELTNGCLCCGAGAKGLAPTVRSLKSRNFDHIVVELSGVADPESVKASFRKEGLVVARAVTLIDADAFAHNMASLDVVADRPSLLAEMFEARAVLPVDSPAVELLLRGLETADTLLVNKCDLAGEEAVQEVVSFCRALNRAAEVVATEYGLVESLDVLLPPSDDAGGMQPRGGDSGSGEMLARQEESQRCETMAIERRDPSSTISLSAPASTSTRSLGFTSFVYRARRPFAERRLASLLDAWPLPRRTVLGVEATASTPGAQACAQKSAGASGDDVDNSMSESPFAGVLRSKGVVWLDSHHEQQVTWSHAGRHLTLEAEQCWWAVLPDTRETRAASDACVGSIPENGASLEYDAHGASRPAIDGDDGDRRQEVVFIGTQLREVAIRAALDACLASEEEVSEYRQRWAHSEPSVETWLSAEHLRRVPL